MDTLWEILKQTPWWVYLLFFFLLKIGYGATKSQTVPFKRLFILPTIFLALSLNTLFTAFNVTASTLAIYGLSLFLGILGGWYIARSLRLKFDKKKNLVQLPGSWTTFVLVLLIFFAKYYFGYSLGVDPSRAEDTSFEIAMLGASGIFTGLFIGRFIVYLLKRNSATHHDL